MPHLLSRLVGRPEPDGPDVEHPVSVIGDVHGRRDLLERLLDRLERDVPDAAVVTVGDYVDRGPDSRGALDLLAAREGVIALKGNHEDMLLGFLGSPRAEGPRWLYNGGVETLESYGIYGCTETSPGADLERAAEQLGEALGPILAWLRERPLAWRTGGLLVCHAGADPSRPPDDQDEADLLWGHPDFGRRRRRDGLWVAHGHTIVEKPFAAGGRIATDTGAVFTGRLTAAIIAPGEPVRFIHT